MLESFTGLLFLDMSSSLTNGSQNKFSMGKMMGRIKPITIHKNKLNVYEYYKYWCIQDFIYTYIIAE